MGIGIAALCMVSASADSGGVATPGTADASGTPAMRTFEFRIDKRKLANDNNTIRVTKGDSVEFHWIADEAMALHVHGYNAETRVTPGMPAVMRFDAYATGRFPVEAHPLKGQEEKASHRGGITLMYLEVHPR